MDSEHDLYKSFADNIADSSDELVEEPPVWPVILWVAFQVQSQIRCNSSSVDVDALITIIESRAQEHSGLWSWDHTDDQMLRAGLLSRNGASAWIDRYPPSWREYILSLGSHDWVRLGDLTRRSARERLAPPEDDAAIRAGAIAVWTSVRSVSPLAPELSTILALDYFVPQDTNHRQFLSCLLEHLENHHDRDLSLELDHWDDPRAWPEYNRRMLQSSVVDKYRNVPLVHVVGNAYMLHQMPHALPQCLISFVFAHLLKKFGDDQPAQAFRAQVNIWKGWDVTTCLANFHQVLSSVLEFSNLIKDEDIQNATSALMRTDILCVCAQFASIFFDLKASQNICKAPNDHIQQLLDLLQDLLDYRLLNPLIHSVLLKGLLKFSKKLKRYPRCFALRDLRLAGDPVAAGSFGDIWKTQFHRETVCVKVMRVYEEGDIEALLKGFHHEALIWRQLAHPNVLPFLGVYFPQEARPRLCLVSPWMENGNVSSYLKRDPAGCNRLTLVLDVALGLEYLHGLNLVHGDLKGLNVLVTHSGRAVLADFGLSSVVTDSKIAIFSASTVKTGGTTRWQAPELLYGGRTNLASDVYALACVFYEIFTGTIPFSELLEVAVILRVIQGDRPKQHPGISASIWNLMMECWETKPSDRPSAVHIVSRLRDCSIGAVQNDAALDWDRWYTAEFRSSLQEHTLFKIDYSPQVPASLHAPTSEYGHIGPIRPVETPVTPSPSSTSASPTPPPAGATLIAAPSPFNGRPTTPGGPNAPSTPQQKSPDTSHSAHPPAPVIVSPASTSNPTLLRKRTSSGQGTDAAKASATAAVAVAGTGGSKLKPGLSVLEQIGETDHAGWMRKKERYNSWKLRYFVLRGPDMYCLKSSNKAETKTEGYINIVGYRITVDEDVNPGRYGFRIDHDHEKTHYFSSDEKTVVRDWMKAIVKATIRRDYSKPVVSSVNIPTIPLIVAQAMNPAPRPPSPTARAATQRAMRRENTDQPSTRDARVLMLTGFVNAETPPKEERTRLDSFTTETVPGSNPPGVVPGTPQSAVAPARPARRMSTQQAAAPVDDGLIEWANSHLPSNLRITDPTGPLCDGLGLLRLAESIKGHPSSPPVPDSAFPKDPSDDNLDGLFRLFDFLLDNEVRMGSVSINEVRQAKRDKIIQLLRGLKGWEDKRKAIATSIGKGSAQAGGFIAPAWR